MLSRVADAIYWMSRYTERAENVARFLDVTLRLNLDLSVGSFEPWEPLLQATGDIEPFTARYQKVTQENVVRFLTFDSDNPNSICSCLQAARENARSIREIIPTELWEQINTLYMTVNAASADHLSIDSPHTFLTQVKRGSHLFEGLSHAIMSHGESWHFSRIGCMLERADQTSRILDVKSLLLLPTSSGILNAIEDIQWAAVLRSTSGFEMYRKRYHHITPERVVGFLLLDRDFPHAVHHCLIKADQSLHAISGSPVGAFSNPAEQQLGQLWAELAYSEVEAILSAGLHDFVDTLQQQLNMVGNALHDTFFAPRPHGSVGGEA